MYISVSLVCRKIGGGGGVNYLVEVPDLSPQNRTLRTFPFQHKDVDIERQP